MIPDVCADHLFVQSHRRYEAASGPEHFSRKVAFPPAELARNRNRTLSQGQDTIRALRKAPNRDERPSVDMLIDGLRRAKWHLWHGCPYPALRRLEGLSWELDADCSLEEARLLARLEEFIGYIENNQRFIVNYGDGYRHGEPITSSFVESAVNQVVSKRFVKRQQMAWRPAHAHGLLQVRTAVLNEQLRSCFER